VCSEVGAVGRGESVVYAYSEHFSFRFNTAIIINVHAIAKVAEYRSCEVNRDTKRHTIILLSSSTVLQ
jgi:hypothetical protein